MGISIIKTNAESDHFRYIDCPYCDNSVAVVHPYCICAVNQEEWVRANDLLSEAYNSTENEFEKPRNWEAFRCTGICENCAQEYLVFELVILNQKASADWWIEFREKGLPAWANSQTFHCELESPLRLFPNSWSGVTTKSENLLIQSHFIGPIAKVSYQLQLARAGSLVRRVRKDLDYVLNTSSLFAEVR